jgi:RNA polymerase sigma-70 factor, ECF subfamily
MSDEEIISQVLEGDRNAFRLLVEKYQSMVFRTCMGFVHQSDDADDLTQEVFIQAYQGLPKFKRESSFSTWLYRIAVNASLNKVRKRSGNIFLQRFESFFGGEKQKTLEIPIPENENPENIIVREEYRQWVQAALDKLPDNQRVAIILSKYDDLSQKEIARIMNITEGAVEALIQRAKENLRKNLSTSFKKSKK